jgi:hypothetical protein
MRGWARRLIAATMLVAGLGAALGLARADAPRVRVAYGDVSGSDDGLIRAHDIMLKDTVLEEMQEFLRPLRLPADLTLTAAQCGGGAPPYNPQTRTVTICYETVARIMQIAAEHTDPDSQDRNEMIVGAIVQSILHQSAYAMFDLFHVPIWGRLDDAADRLSALVMIQFGEDSANTTIRGAARFFDMSNRTWTGGDFASDVSPEAQRFYNYLCIAYGGDPIAFDDLVRNGALPEARAGRCAGEYQEIRKAFNLRIMPFVDPDLLVRARARQW